MVGHAGRISTEPGYRLSLVPTRLVCTPIVFT